MQSAATSADVQRTYLTLVLLQTAAASLIWGINTLFLLDAGLSITEAFVANAAYTAGMVLFEVPTGVVADAAGRRASFMLGAATLLVTTLAYLALWQWEAGIVWWVVVSALIGLGFTFFSGATEAWLIDALGATGFAGNTESVFGKGQTVAGAATLIGTVAGGFLAQINLGVPYLVRSALLIAVIVAAYLWMRDLGYEPRRGGSIMGEVSAIVKASITHGLGNRPVRLLMFAAPFSMGVGIWVYYAFQPYLLELFGDPSAVYLSGLAAAVFAIAQMVGGSSVSSVRRRVTTRSGVLLIRNRSRIDRTIGGRCGAVARHSLWFLARHRPFDDQRSRRCDSGADGAGARQSSDPISTAGHRAVLLLADGVGGRGRLSASFGSSR